jgi:DNA-binding FadR family transcriptional regulator
MEAALRTRSLGHDAHFRFHLTIAEATGNAFFVNVINLMRPYMDIAMNLLRDLWVLDASEQINTGRHQHQQIYDAIAAGRPAEASRAMLLHLDEARRELFGDLSEAWPRRDLTAGKD